MLPKQAVGMVRRIGPVQQAAAVAAVSDAAVYRNDRIPVGETGVAAADLRLLEAVGGTVAKGRFLNAATARYPATVLGALPWPSWASTRSVARSGWAAAGSPSSASWTRSPWPLSWTGPR